MKNIRSFLPSMITKGFRLNSSTSFGFLDTSSNSGTNKLGLEMTNYPNLFPLALGKVFTLSYICWIVLLCINNSSKRGILTKRLQVVCRSTYFKLIPITFLALCLIRQEVCMYHKAIDNFSGMLQYSKVKAENGIPIHYLHRPSEAQSLSVFYLLYHGFGASSLSYKPFIDAVASRGDSTTELFAFDTLGFGMNPRKDRLSNASSRVASAVYRPSFNTVASLNIVSSEMKGRHSTVNNHCVMLGHSMGSKCAVLAAVKALHDWKQAHNNCTISLVLIAPAIVLNRNSDIVECKDANSILGKVHDYMIKSAFIDNSRTENKTKENPVKEVISVIVRLVSHVTWRLMLTRLLRTDRLWKTFLSGVWGKEMSTLDDEVVLRYKLPTIGFAFLSDFINFIKAQQSTKSFSFTSTSACEDVDYVQVLLALIKENSVRDITFIHGEVDRIIPAANSVRIVERLKASLDQEYHQKIKLKVVDGAGHCPHEELPQEFVDAANEFTRC